MVPGATQAQPQLPRGWRERKRVAEVRLLQEAEGLGFSPPCAGTGASGRPWPAPEGMELAGAAQGPPSSRGQVQTLPRILPPPTQCSALLHRDPPLPPAVGSADPSGAGHPAPVQDLSLPPASCQHIVSRTHVLLGSLGPCPSPGSAGSSYVLPSWTQPAWSATHRPPGEDGAAFTCPSRPLVPTESQGQPWGSFSRS